ncbi:MAG: 1-phosphofructokinase family hexose kinase [Verrucomicrobiae bacterium]|nr:1-phosphofructokinase family hexose kinase [Verrucomicrobiae bacterium]
MVLTVTLNPSLDRSLVVESLRRDVRVFSSGNRLEPGGKGINVSRVLARMGVSSHMLALVGGPEGEIFERLCRTERLPLVPVRCADSTRTNLTLSSHRPRAEYKINEAGPRIRPGELREFLKTYRRLLRGKKYVVLGGSLPPGVPPDFYARLVREAQRSQVRTAVDCDGSVLRKTAAATPWLIKPNRHELAELVGKKQGSFRQIEAAAIELIHSRRAENILVSMGAKGAVLLGEAEIPGSVRGVRCAVGRSDDPSSVRSTVGAGDTLLGAFVGGLCRGLSEGESLGLAVACASLTVAKPGTELVSARELGELMRSFGIHGKKS